MISDSIVENCKILQKSSIEWRLHQHECLCEEFFSALLIQCSGAEEDVFAAVFVFDGVDQLPSCPEFHFHALVCHEEDDGFLVASDSESASIEGDAFEIESMSFDSAVESSLPVGFETGFHGAFFGHEDATASEFSQVEFEVVLCPEAVALPSGPQHFVPLAFCGGGEIRTAIGVNDLHA